MTRALLFDLFDTLATARWLDLESQMAQLLGVEVETVRDGYRANGYPLLTGRLESPTAEMAAVAAAAGKDPTPALAAAMADIESAFFSSEVGLFSDAAPVLHELQSMDVTTAIVSNCSLGAAAVVDHLELATMTDRVVLSCRIGIAKPEPGIYHHALDALELRPNEAVFVDDQLPYLDGARDLGLATAQMVHTDSPNDHPRTGDHMVLTGVADVMQLL